MSPNNEELVHRIELLEREMREHLHNGISGAQVYVKNLFGVFPSNVPLATATIATTGNTDGYIIAPINGKLVSVDFSGVDALATSDTNYITWTVTNLGQAGAGTTVMLAAVAGNTTKATGGIALSANTKRSLSMTGVDNDTKVQVGDRLLVRAAATGTLANTVTFPTYVLRFI